jgi:hypothetical protein
MHVAFRFRNSLAFPPEIRRIVHTTNANLRHARTAPLQPPRQTQNGHAVAAVLHVALHRKSASLRGQHTFERDESGATSIRIRTKQHDQDCSAQQKSPGAMPLGFFTIWPGGNLLSRTQCTLSSAQTRFTVLFGMGRRGSRLLWPPDWLWIRRGRSQRPRHRRSRFGIQQDGIEIVCNATASVCVAALLTVIGSSRTGN